MAGSFHDHPRKKTVRERWDTPLLRWLRFLWQAKFFYFGLPGPKAIDLWLWKDIVIRIIAFEQETEDPRNPRCALIELNRQLALLGIRNAVFCGPMEEVILRRQDYDHKPFSPDDFVTLYNLDFCGAITERIVTGGQSRCLRFEALREIASLQRDFYRQTHLSRFVLFITTRDEFDERALSKGLRKPDLPQATKDFVARIGVPTRLGKGMARSTELLRAFVFTFIRECFGGQNITSVFLPPIAYMGSSDASPMVHFAVVCKMGPEEDPHVSELQSADQFFDLRLLRATDTQVQPIDDAGAGHRCELDPVAFVRNFAL